jgi:hypothetical protein
MEIKHWGRKSHVEELHNLYTSPNIIGMIKSRRVRWAGYVASMGRRELHTKLWLKYLKERDHLIGVSID